MGPPAFNSAIGAVQNHDKMDILNPLFLGVPVVSYSYHVI